MPISENRGARIRSYYQKAILILPYHIDSSGQCNNMQVVMC